MVNIEGKYFFVFFEYIFVLDWGIVVELFVEDIYRFYKMFEKMFWIVLGVMILLFFFFIVLYVR